MKVKRRPFILLEVLIAIALVAICAIPLIYPHAKLLELEKRYLREIQLDRQIANLYVDILSKLYNNEISWEEIEEGKEFSNEEGACYQFKILKKKEEVGSYLVDLEIFYRKGVGGKALNKVLYKINLRRGGGVIEASS